MTFNMFALHRQTNLHGRAGWIQMLAVASSGCVYKLCLIGCNSFGDSWRICDIRVVRGSISLTQTQPNPYPMQPPYSEDAVMRQTTNFHTIQIIASQRKVSYILR